MDFIYNDFDQLLLFSKVVNFFLSTHFLNADRLKQILFTINAFFNVQPIRLRLA